jgi:hypothetical protein
LTAPPPHPVAAAAHRCRRLVHVSVKSEATPAPIERSEAQSIPLGAYYDYILKEPQPNPADTSVAPPSSESAAESKKKST